MKVNILSIFLILGTITVSRAQDMAEEADTARIRNLNIEEITIKSTKYNSDIFYVPAAATKLSSQVIVNNKIENLTDLSGFVPNFFMPDYGSKLTSPVYIRGIGTRINSPSVGLYVDNIPYFEKSAFNFDFFDIESIDVLRGPQGTLYGRNTLAGLINITTRQPGKERNGSVMVDYGNYNQVKTQLSYNQPLTDKMAVILNAGQVHHDGFFTNHFNEKKADKLNSYSGRMKFNYDVCSAFNTQLTLQYENSRQGGYPYALYNKTTQQAGEVNYDSPSSYDRDLFSAGWAMNADLGSIYISSATSYQYLKDYQGIDQDFTPKSLFFVDQHQQENMWAQELTVSSEKGKTYEWLFGAFAFKQTLDKEVTVTYGADGIVQYKLPGASNYTKYYDNTNSGGAFFHQSVLNIGKLSFTAGLRADYEKATLDYSHDKVVKDVFTHVEDVKSDQDYFVLLPKASLSYEISQGLSSYATVARGYNSGGFNSTFEREQDRSFKPEFSWNYEIGFKTRCMENRVISSLSFFYVDWKDQQIYQAVPSGKGSMLTNAGKSESKGVEFELRYRATKKLETWGMFGYNEAKFVRYVKDNQTDYSGNYLPYVPRFSFNAGANYTIDVQKKLLDRMRLQLQYQGFGKHYWSETNLAWQDYYGLLSGRISLEKKLCTLSFWTKNLLDADYNSFYFEALGNSYAQLGKPVLAGASLKVRF